LPLAPATATENVIAFLSLGSEPRP
jgi:hypothetical protein